MTTGEVIALIKAFGGGGGSSGGGVLMVHADENGVLDKTYAEIKSASNNGVVVFDDNGDIFYLSFAEYNTDSNAYSVAFFGSEIFAYFEADAEDGYPVRVEG